MRAAAIVVGTDGSASAGAAVEQAADLACTAGAALHVVTGYAKASDAVGAVTTLTSTKVALRGRGAVHLHAVPGEPAAALCRVASRVRADIIVVGNRGIDARLHRMRRPVCEQVQRRAPCPVVVVDTGAWWRPTTPDTAQTREPVRAREWKVLATTTVAVFMAFLDVTIVNVAFPDIAADFRSTPLADLSWVLNAYNVVFAAMLVPAGRLADRVGRRRMFMSGLWGFLVGSLLCAAAPSAAALILARVVQAVGAAALIPASLALVLPEFPPEKRAEATSVWAAAGAVAAATGPSLGGVLVDAWGWRAAFLVNLVIALAIVPGRRLLVERRDPDVSSPDLAGGVLLAAGVGAIALGIVKAPEWGWGGDRVVGCGIAGAALLAVVVARSRRHPSPVLETELLRVRLFALSTAAFFLFSVGLYALLLCNVLFLTHAWGYSILQAGFAVTPGPLMAAVAAGLGGRIAEHRGPRALAVPAALLFGAACLLYRHVAVAVPDYAGHWLPAQIVSGTAIGLVFAGLATASVMDLPPNRLATGTAMTSCARQLGAVLGIAGLVDVIGTPKPWEILDAFHRAYLLMALFALAAAAVAHYFGRRRPGEAEPVPLARRRPRVQIAGTTRAEVVLHNHRIVLRTAGDGPPMLLVHGLLDSSTTWRRLAPALALRHRVIAVDLLGHGESDAPAAVDYSLLGHAMVLRDLLDHLEIDRAAVVGHSLGGGIAMALAHLFPERVDRIVLISSGGLGPELGRHLRLAALPGAGPVLRGLGSPPVTKALDAAAAALAAARRRRVARAVQEVGHALARMGEKTARGAFLSSARSVIGPHGQRVCALDYMERLHRHPLLLFHGTADRTIPCAHSVGAADVHPNAQVVLLEGIGHVPHLAQPAYIAERITAFTAVAPDGARERVVA